jgi:hypothetical protein
MTLIDAVIASTIERCARVCEAMAAAPWNFAADSEIARAWHAARSSGQRHAAAQIRALKSAQTGEKEEGMTGASFRIMAAVAVDQVAKFLDEFPECFVTFRAEGAFGVLVVGLEETSAQTGEKEEERQE